MRSLLAIMREAYRYRKRGAPVPDALDAAVNGAAEWDCVWQALVASAEQDESLRSRVRS